MKPLVISLLAASALEAVRNAVPDWKGSGEFALIDTMTLLSYEL